MQMSFWQIWLSLFGLDAATENWSEEKGFPPARGEQTEPRQGSV